MQYLHVLVTMHMRTFGVMADAIDNATNNGNRGINLLRGVILPGVIIALLIGALITKRWVAMLGVAVLGGLAVAIANNPGALADIGHLII